VDTVEAAGVVVATAVDALLFAFVVEVGGSVGTGVELLVATFSCAPEALEEELEVARSLPEFVVVDTVEAAGVVVATAVDALLSAFVVEGGGSVGILPGAVVTSDGDAGFASLHFLLPELGVFLEYLVGCCGVWCCIFSVTVGAAVVTGVPLVRGRVAGLGIAGGGVAFWVGVELVSSLVGKSEGFSGSFFGSKVGITGGVGGVGGSEGV